MVAGGLCTQFSLRFFLVHSQPCILREASTTNLGEYWCLLRLVSLHVSGLLPTPWRFDVGCFLLRSSSHCSRVLLPCPRSL